MIKGPVADPSQDTPQAPQITPVRATSKLVGGALRRCRQVLPAFSRVEGGISARHAWR
jgi:hypothetical protein